MGIEVLTVSQLKDNVRRYREQGVTTGGHYSLAELLQELNNRVKPGAFGTVETARKIIELSGQSTDGLISYGDLWKAFRPNEPWSVFKSRKAVTDALAQVGYYCVRHKLPLIITLVVNAGKNALTDKAKSNIYEFWTDRGLESDGDRDAFITRQQELSRQLTATHLPDDK